MSLTWVYGLVAARRRPSLAEVPSGPPGTGPVRLLEAGPAAPGGPALWVLAADAPPDAFGPEAIERGLQDLDWVSSCAMAHEAVVEALLGRGTVVPLKLFTLFSSDARALAHVKSMKKRLRAVLAEIEGCAEWGVRVAPRPRARPARAARPATPLTGTQFLEQRRREREALRTGPGAEAVAALEPFWEALSGAARRAVRKTVPAAPGSRTLLDGALLVPTRRAGAFRQALGREAERLGAVDLEVTLTGPWPPWHFVGAR